MNELHLIQKAKTILSKNGGIAWSGARWNDVFGIFDVIFLDEKGHVSFYQVSTKDHRWSRMHKIDRFRADYVTDLPRDSYLMLWDYNANEFTYEPL